MNREEMLKRLKAGEDPFDLSIEKWKDIVDCLEKIHSVKEFDSELEQSEEKCPLCIAFPEDCGGCPICEETGVPDCLNTPYYDFRNAKREGDLPAMLNAANQMLVLLKLLNKLRNCKNDKSKSKNKS